MTDKSYNDALTEIRTQDAKERLDDKRSYYEFIMDLAKGNPVEGAFMLCTGLMRGNKANLQLGYSFGAALIATLGQIPLNANEIGVLVDRISIPKPGLVDYGPTPRA